MVSLSTVPVLTQAELRTANVEMFCLQISAQIFSEFQRNFTLKQCTLSAGFFFFLPSICSEVPICYAMM